MNLETRRGAIKVLRQLDHAERNKVVAAYARSEHLVERRKVMDDWGMLVSTLAAGDNVIPISIAA